MTFFRGIAAAIRHRRVVKSGSPPLYLLMLVGAIISGLLQIVRDVPQSISATGSTWIDYMFMFLQLVGGTVALVSLYIEDGSARHAERLYWSLSFEAFGLALLATVGVVYAAAVTIANGGPPTSWATWSVVMFGVWAVRTRIPDIIRALQELKS